MTATLPVLWWRRRHHKMTGPTGPPITSFTFQKDTLNFGTSVAVIAFVPLTPVPPYHASFTGVSAKVPAGAVAPTVAKFALWFYPTNTGPWTQLTALTDVSAATTTTSVNMPLLPGVSAIVFPRGAGEEWDIGGSKDVTEGNAGSNPSIDWTYSLIITP